MELFLLDVSKGNASVNINISSFTDVIKTFYSISSDSDICNNYPQAQRRFYRVRSEDCIAGLLTLESSKKFFLVDFNVFYISCPKNSTIQKITAGWNCVPDSKLVSRAYSQIEGVVFLECPKYCKNCSESTIVECDVCADGYYRNSPSEHCIHQSQG